MPKDKKVTAKCAFYKSRRKRGMTNEEIRKLWDAKLEAEKAK